MAQYLSTEQEKSSRFSDVVRDTKLVYLRCVALHSSSTTALIACAITGDICKSNASGSVPKRTLFHWRSTRQQQFPTTSTERIRTVEYLLVYRTFPTNSTHVGHDALLNDVVDLDDHLLVGRAGGRQDEGAVARVGDDGQRRVGEAAAQRAPELALVRLQLGLPGRLQDTANDLYHSGFRQQPLLVWLCIFRQVLALKQSVITVFLATAFCTVLYLERVDVRCMAVNVHEVTTSLCVHTALPADVHRSQTRCLQIFGVFTFKHLGKEVEWLPDEHEANAFIEMLECSRLTFACKRTLSLQCRVFSDGF